LIESCPSVGLTVRWSRELQLGRHLARLNDGGEIDGFLLCEVARDANVPARDRLVNVRRRHDVIVQHDGKLLSGVLGRRLVEFARAVAIQTESDLRAVLFVKALRGIGDVGPDDLRNIVHQQRARLVTRQQAETRFHSTGLRSPESRQGWNRPG
jgi:hypothetical protein